MWTLKKNTSRQASSLIFTEQCVIVVVFISNNFFNFISETCVLFVNKYFNYLSINKNQIATKRKKKECCVRLVGMSGRATKELVARLQFWSMYDDICYINVHSGLQSQIHKVKKKKVKNICTDATINGGMYSYAVVFI